MKSKSTLRLGAFLAVALILNSASWAADKKELQAALAAVEANLKTSAGKQYDELAGKELTEKYLSSLRPCKQSLPPGTRIDPFDMFLRLNSDGKVQEGLVYPETQFAGCARSALLAAKFSRPPHDEYWINIHMEFKH
jgi:hypothetical protein